MKNKEEEALGTASVRALYSASWVDSVGCRIDSESFLNQFHLHGQRGKWTIPNAHGMHTHDMHALHAHDMHAMHTHDMHVLYS